MLRSLVGSEMCIRDSRSLVPLLLVLAISLASPDHQPDKCTAGSCSDALQRPIRSDAMQYRRLGRSGLWVSALSYGAWVTFGSQIGDDQAYDIMRAAIGLGINTFDNAEVYEAGTAELMMGRVLQRLFSEGWPREQFVLTTKIFQTTRNRAKQGPNDFGLGRKHIIEGLRRSLRRMQLEYVDVVFAHRPDPHTPMEEIVRAFNFVIEQGMAFYWGTSEWSAVEITEAHSIARRLGLVGPVAEQPQYNLLWRQRFEVEYAPVWREYGLGSTVWSVLAGGILTGKYNQGIPPGSRLSMDQWNFLKDRAGNFEESLESVARLGPIAEELGCTVAQLSLAWALSNPNVSTLLLGGTKINQIISNVKALEMLPKLTREVLDRIEDAVGGAPVQVVDNTGRTGLTNYVTD
eukprot:TRINITY_DN36122_c0_g1_i1.p1 TRINITY_DN36122_c0_g1~~TRINITY_DN36122_c0_g1_i1.p1  ORF type:complete len:404 (-),score=95.27 TRINITY_DN36122_c0_g1_i1:371-1582(-)